MPLFRRTVQDSQAPESADCGRHEPCRRLLAIPAEQIDSRLRLMTTRVADVGSGVISAQLNQELAGRLVAMDEQRDPSVPPQALVVPVHFLSRWNTTSRELLDRALTNANSQRLEVSAHNLPQDAVMYTVSRPDLVDATQLLRLDQVLGRELPYGAFVTVPKVNAVCVQPLLRASHVAMLPDALALLHRVAAQGPGAPSLDAFWFHDGRLDPLNAQMKGDRMERIFPPHGFEDTMARLPR